MTEKVIIVGGGPAGYTAAIYAARANLNPLQFEGFMAGGMAGGQLMTTGIVENFPGFPTGIDGQELMAQMREQAVRCGARILAEDVASIALGGSPFKLISEAGAVYETLSVILATGATARRLDLPSEKRLWGRGISACAVCDGALPIFRNKALAVIGGGDSALEEALHLTQFGSKVYLVHRRDEFRASKIMQTRVKEHPKIQILWNKTVLEFLGDQRISGLRLNDIKTGEQSELLLAGVFEAIGHHPNTPFLNKQIDLDENGYIVTRARTAQTSRCGVFAAGDVQDPHYRQAITSAASGCMAALDAERWLLEQNACI